MKDGLRFVDSDMHIMEPPDLFERYLDPKFRHRVSVPGGLDGRPSRGTAGPLVIDALPTPYAALQQSTKRIRRSSAHATPLLSASRLHDADRLPFPFERDSD